VGWPDECRQTAWFASAQKLMFPFPLHNKRCCGESRLSKPLPNSPALFDNAEGFFIAQSFISLALVEGHRKK